MSVGRNPLAASPVREINAETNQHPAPLMPPRRPRAVRFSIPRCNPMPKVVRLAPGTALAALSFASWQGRAAAEDLALREKNPFAAYKASYYWDWIAGHRPAYRPGTTAIYSGRRTRCPCCSEKAAASATS
jgi:hypothetical protein